MPDPDLQPEGSVVVHKAVDTPFLNCDDDECDVEISGAKVPLQRITLNLPPGECQTCRILARLVRCPCSASPCTWPPVSWATRGQEKRRAMPYSALC